MLQYTLVLQWYNTVIQYTALNAQHPRNNNAQYVSSLGDVSSWIGSQPFTRLGQHPTSTHNSGYTVAVLFYLLVLDLFVEMDSKRQTANNTSHSRPNNYSNIKKTDMSVLFCYAHFFLFWGVLQNNHPAGCLVLFCWIIPQLVLWLIPNAPILGVYSAVNSEMVSNTK